MTAALSTHYPLAADRFAAISPTASPTGPSFPNEIHWNLCAI